MGPIMARPGRSQRYWKSYWSPCPGSERCRDSRVLKPLCIVLGVIMDNGHNPKLRFGMSLEQARQSSSHSGIADAPALPVVNYALVGKQAPGLLSAPAGALPKASAVVITWAEAEWAALQHVFCRS